MARFIFPKAGAGAASAETATLSYKKFIEAAEGMVTLRGKHLEDEAGRRTMASEFLKELVSDPEITLTPEIRYISEEQANVSPLTRARHTGWRVNQAFLSVNTLVGLLCGGQLPEVRAVRSRPRPTGRVEEMDHIIGQWMPREKLELYAVDTDGNVEPIESWIERKLADTQ